jgi:signal transduction histidine kinase
MIDALIENVFSHTPVGTAFTLSLGVQGDLIQLVVEDEGPGFSDEEGVLMRGASFGGSTGLGLDIARRLAVSCGGDLRLETRPAGGARVVVSMRQAADTGVGVSID